MPRAGSGPVRPWRRARGPPAAGRWVLGYWPPGGLPLAAVACGRCRTVRAPCPVARRPPLRLDLRRLCGSACRATSRRLPGGDARCGLDFLLSLAGPWAVGLDILVGRHSVFLRPIREQRDCSLSSTSSPPFTLHPASKIHGGALGGLHGSGGGRGGSSPP